MGTEWSKVSSKKLGAIGSVPVLPMLPVAAQICKYSSKVHYKMDTEGHYLNGRIPYVPPARLKEVSAAIKAQPLDKSYSETETKYYALDVVPDPDNKDRFLVMAGAVLVGFGLIDPAAQIVSTDEPIGDQMDDDGDADGDGDED